MSIDAENFVGTKQIPFDVTPQIDTQNRCEKPKLKSGPSICTENVVSGEQMVFNDIVDQQKETGNLCERPKSHLKPPGHLSLDKYRFKIPKRMEQKENRKQKDNFVVKQPLQPQLKQLPVADKQFRDNESNHMLKPAPSKPTFNCIQEVRRIVEPNMRQFQQKRQEPNINEPNYSHANQQNMAPMQPSTSAQNDVPWTKSHEQYLMTQQAMQMMVRQTFGNVQNQQAHLASTRNTMVNAHRFLAPESPMLQRKKPKLTIKDLIDKGNKQAEHAALQKLPKVRPNNGKRNQIGRISMKTTLALVQRNPPQTEATIDCDALLKECQKRLETDPNYKKSAYDIDFVRITVLKLPPNGKVEPEKTKQEIEPTKTTERNENPSEFTFFDDQSEFKMDESFNFSFGEENEDKFDFQFP